MGPTDRCQGTIACQQRSYQGTTSGKRIKRVPFGMAKFVHWRAPILLYAGGLD